jgi:hypothetical protein
MTKMLTETSWLLDRKSNLVQLKQELWLTQAEAAIVDRGIAAIDSFLVEFAVPDERKAYDTERK